MYNMSKDLSHIHTPLNDDERMSSQLQATADLNKQSPKLGGLMKHLGSNSHDGVLRGKHV